MAKKQIVASKHCPDCGKAITRNATRCASCAKRGKRHPMWGIRGEDNPLWRGGQQFNKATGYWYIHQPDHPKANKRGYIKRAILVLEAKLGRHIRDGYDTHHINLVKDDDKAENLEEREHFEHKAYHSKLRVGNKNPAWKGGISCQKGSAK